MADLTITINVNQVTKAAKTVEKSFDKIAKEALDVNKAVGTLDKGLDELRSGMISGSGFSLKYAKALSTVKKEVRDTTGANDSLKKKLDEINDVTKKASNQTSVLSGLFKTIKAAAVGYTTVLATMEIQQFVADTVRAKFELEGLSNTFTAVTGTSFATAQEMSFLSSTARDLGLNLRVLEQSYKGIFAASKNTKLEGEATRDIFLAVNKAAAVLGMSSDDTSGALRALSQMISKGNVQAEEFSMISVVYKLLKVSRFPMWRHIVKKCFNCGKLLLGLDYRTRFCYTG